MVVFFGSPDASAVSHSAGFGFRQQRECWCFFVRMRTAFLAAARALGMPGGGRRFSPAAKALGVPGGGRPFSQRRERSFHTQS